MIFVCKFLGHVVHFYHLEIATDFHVKGEVPEQVPELLLCLKRRFCYVVYKEADSTGTIWADAVTGKLSPWKNSQGLHEI